MSEKNICNWAEISRVKHASRYDFLSAKLNAAGLKNKVTYFDFPTSEFDLEIDKIKAQYDQLKIGSPYGEILANALSQSALISFSLQSCDALMKQDGKWWPRSFLEVSFVETMIREFGTLDIDASAIIIGCGTSARAVFSALLKLGYRKFLFAEYFEEKATQTLKDLRQRYFNVELRFISQDELAYLPGICSVVVNTTPHVEDNVLLKDLYYFNYLNKNAVVVDTNYYPLDPSFIQQAADLNVRLCDGVKVCADLDIAWVKSCFGLQLNTKEYTEEWRQHLSHLASQT